MAADVKIAIVGDAAQLRRVLREVEGELDRQGQKTAEVGEKMQRAGAVALGAGGLMFAGMQRAANTASDLNEAVNQTDVVFGEAADEVSRFAENAVQIGQSERAAREAASTFGLLFRNVGMAQSASADMSVTLTRLASDAASFKNTSPEEAVQAFSSALRGESEPIRAYGVMLDEAAVKQKAMELGLVSAGAELTNAAKVQARYALILEQSSTFANDFINTSDSLANQQRITAAEAENAAASFGQGFIPIMQKAQGAARAAAGAFGQLDESTGGFASTATVALGSVLVLGGAFSSLVGTVVRIHATWDQTVATLGRVRQQFVTTADDGTRSMTKLGTAVTAAGGALTAFAASAGVMATLNEISDASGKAERAVQRLLIATKEGTGEDLVRQFAGLAKVEDDTLRMSHLWEDMGKSIKITGTDSARSIEDIDRAFGKVLDTSQASAKELLDAWRAQNAALDHSSGQYRDNEMLIKRYQERLDLAAGAQKALASEATGATNATAALGGAAASTGAEMGAMSYDLLSSAQAAETLAASVSSARASVVDFPGALADLSDGWSEVDDAARSTGGTMRDVAAEMRAVRDASESLTDAQEDLVDAERALDELRKGPTQRTKDDAELGVREARLGVQRASAAVTEAETRLAEARKKGDAKAIGDAELDLEQARISHIRSAQALTDAEADLVEVQNFGKEGTEAYTEAEDRLEDAKRRVRDATEALERAEATARGEGATGGPVADRSRNIAKAFESQVGQIFQTIDKLRELGVEEGIIQKVLADSSIKVEEYGKKYGVARDRIDEVRDALDKLALLADSDRVARAAGALYNVPGNAAAAAAAAVASGAYNPNAAPAPITARVVVPLIVNGTQLGEALIDVQGGYN